MKSKYAKNKIYNECRHLTYHSVNYLDRLDCAQFVNTFNMLKAILS